MSPQQAFEQQIMADFSHYILKVAHQAGVIVGLQNRIQELEAQITEPTKSQEPRQKAHGNK